MILGSSFIMGGLPLLGVRSLLGGMLMVVNEWG